MEEEERLAGLHCSGAATTLFRDVKIEAIYVGCGFNFWLQPLTVDTGLIQLISC